MRIGLVAPRYGAEVSGEGPRRARALAEGLAARGHLVEVWTTTALDPVTWESVLPAGSRREGGLVLHRLASRKALSVRVREASPPEAFLFFGGLDADGGEAMAEAPGPCVAWPDGSVAGAAAPDWGALRPSAMVLFSSVEEEACATVGGRLAGRRTRAVGYGLDLPPPPSVHSPSADDPGERGPYLVHAGPLEARDGCAAVVEGFLRYQRASRSRLSLLLVGRGRVDLRESAHVRVLGELGEGPRRRVIAGARAVLVPSRQEALSPLVLEGWTEARPAVACGSSRVLGATLERTGGGLACRGSDELALVLDLLERDPALADALGRAGREALAAEHALPGVLERVERSLLEAAAERTAA